MNSGMLVIIKNRFQKLKVLVVRKRVNEFEFNIDVDYQVIDKSKNGLNLINKNIGSRIKLNFLNEPGTWEIERKYYYTENFTHLYDISGLDNFVLSVKKNHDEKTYISSEIVNKFKKDIFLKNKFWNHNKMSNELCGEIIMKYWDLEPINKYPSIEPYKTLLKLSDKKINCLNAAFVLEYWEQIPKILKEKIKKEIELNNIFLDKKVFFTNKFWLDGRLTQNIAKDILSIYTLNNYSERKYPSVEPYSTILKLIDGKNVIINKQIVDLLNKKLTIAKGISNILNEKNVLDFESFDVFVDYFLLTHPNSLLSDIYKKIRKFSEKFKKTNNKEKLFVDLHTEIINYLKIRALEDDKEIDMRPIIPKCLERKDLIHCEGSIYEEYGYSYWCRNKACERKKINKNTALKKQEWSLLEIFDYYLININFNNSYLWQLNFFDSLNDYVRKIAGALNRLNEIRERLKCRSCGKIMFFDWKYPIRKAAYKVTVAKCANKDCSEHGKGVYLNHCWACGNIIDGRENTVVVEGYRLCLECGSGPQNPTTYIQGDICPKCGSHFIESKNNNKYYTCNNCKHIIKRPPDNKITGLYNFTN
ncbi:MAG: hypothetical protein ACOCP8_03650 [archaeon]